MVMRGYTVIKVTVIKGSVCQEDTTLITIYAPNEGAGRQILNKSKNRHWQKYNNNRGLQHSSFHEWTDNQEGNSNLQGKTRSDDLNEHL